MALVSYIRVSTSHQGRSGLGIEAQREALARFADAEGSRKEV
jgi:DNA invertase Pin-like site-specific DNA recombinase